MTFFADTVGTGLIDVDALPWVPFLPYSDQLHLKLIKLNSINGDWNVLDENDNVVAVENWRTMLKRYSDHCAATGIAPIDITGFGGN